MVHISLLNYGFGSTLPLLMYLFIRRRHLLDSFCSNMEALGRRRMKGCVCKCNRNHQRSEVACKSCRISDGHLGLAGNKINYDLKTDNREAPNQISKLRKSGRKMNINAPNYKKSLKNMAISTIGFKKKVQQCRDGDTRKGLCGICCWRSGKKSRILGARTSIFLAKAFHTNLEDQFLYYWIFF